jgi:hypothetical protein
MRLLYGRANFYTGVFINVQKMLMLVLKINHKFKIILYFQNYFFYENQYLNINKIINISV